MPKLSKQLVFEAAVQVADERGLASVSMRKVAERLGVEAMSLYHHVANKDEILDGIADVVFAQIELPGPEVDWKDALRQRAVSTRSVLSRHPWALGFLESRRTPGPVTMRHHDWVIGRLREAGFTIAMAAHALAVVDSYVFGFVLQERTLPLDTPAEVADVAKGMFDLMEAGAYPHLTEMIKEHALRPGYAFADEFPFGLDLILDGLERLQNPNRPSE
ncbi:TetR family transcriptional regulator [Rhizocola hellebori]|uniref:TetR family transcriptional regulator n=1 Tax=Rhizocola hellebori TaxID=1392758 RepID=A0A8J3Q2U6_9ACTN|nr:TetR/AcrR family transcriptional regulator [Rhizocola hellebori]GIH02255.1 TetR family transcriptional regulator [Rhizocola hellebori]